MTMVAVVSGGHEGGDGGDGEWWVRVFTIVSFSV